ncbi:MAG TPA: nitrogenase component 1 [Clostridia bacterium]|nr:nitrogenase component 1 [Clostridia bacterium]
MCNCNTFSSTLHYETPAHGGWGVVRMGMLAPESYQLFVCPFACGRHGALGAVKQGLKDRVSYYYIDQSDIISGYDDIILEAVDELLEQIDTRPRAMFVMVSCLDDLIGTDCDTVEQVLNERHPDIQFRMAHMNPITLGSDEPPPVGIQKRIYSLLAPQSGRDNAINTIGNLVEIDPACELHKMLWLEGGQQIRHISAYKSFDAWQKMARSVKNFVLMPMGIRAAQEMETRCGTPYKFLPVSYDLEVIAEQYRAIHEFVNANSIGVYDFSHDIAKAQTAIRRAKEKIGDYPIIIDASAAIRPFSLAKALCGYGFNVVRVFAEEVIPPDRNAYEWVCANLPAMEVFQPQHYDVVKFDKRFEDSLAIGFNAAYISGSRHVVDLVVDEGMFGYYGVITLMNMMEKAINAQADLRAMIDAYGLVV